MSSLPTPAEHPLIEGVARVVAIEGGRVRLEPEQQGGCGGCASAAACNEKGIGTLANRLEARRFDLPNELSLHVGDRVVLGVPAHSLVAASAIVYLIPLAASLGSAVLAQWRFGEDGATLLAALGGLLPGFLLLKWLGGRRDERAAGYRILRLATPGAHCK